MRVGFDVSALAAPHSTGVRRVARSVLERLERRGRLEVVRLAPGDGERLASWRQRVLPRAVRRYELAGLHSFTSALPLRGPGRRVHTVHELPWRHGVRENADLRHRLWATLGTRRADRVVCATRHVARDLRGPWLAEDRIRVVPWGVQAPFVDAPASAPGDEPGLPALALGEEACILCPGAVRPKKNLAAVLAGVASLVRGGEPAPRVIVTGGATAQTERDLALARELGLAHRTSVLEPVSDEVLAALLRRAVAVPVLSHSEGFGLTVLEALACGTQVIVPAGTAQAEVAGEPGIVIPSTSAEHVAAGLRAALQDGANRDRRAARVRRAAGFTWDACAAGLESVWEELA